MKTITSITLFVIQYKMMINILVYFYSCLYLQKHPIPSLYWKVNKYEWQGHDLKFTHNFLYRPSHFKQGEASSGNNSNTHATLAFRDLYLRKSLGIRKQWWILQILLIFILEEQKKVNEHQGLLFMVKVNNLRYCNAII